MEIIYILKLCLVSFTLSLMVHPIDCRSTTVPRLESKPWPNNSIPYVIDERFDAYVKKRIKDAINSFNAHSPCLRFAHKTNELNYLTFVFHSNSCKVKYTGFQSQGEQFAHLAPSCSVARHIYFILLTTAGLPAEHRRPSRDNYVKVYWKNIKRRKRKYFKKYESIDSKLDGLPYDRQSLLHFPRNKHVMPGNNSFTIVDKNNPDIILGNSLMPTFYDYLKVSALYCDTSAEITRSVSIAPANTTTTEITTTTGTRTSTANDTAWAEHIQDQLGHLTGAVTSAPHIYSNCHCFDYPPDPDSGTCDGELGFQFKGMIDQCVNSSHAYVCECENTLLHPCSCVVETEADCTGNNCQICKKECREKH